MRVLDLMTLHCDALYVHNNLTELVCINDWLERPAPFFWMGFTREGVFRRFRYDVSAESRVQAERLLNREPNSPEARLPEHHDALRELFGAQNAIAGPTYWLSALSAESSRSAQRISADNAIVLRERELDAWVPDIPHQQPMFASLEDGRAVAVCASVRSTSLAHEAGVETLSAHRRQGHATAAVAAWAQELLGAGVVPLYSTTWDNLASQRVATGLGFKAFGWEYRIG